jgi:hypothetical protein
MAVLCSRCKGVKPEDQPISCVAFEGGPCSPCKERAAIRQQIKWLEEEITKLKAKYNTVGTTMNAVHDPFIHKLPPEIGSRILCLSLPTLNNGMRDAKAIHGLWSIKREWAAPLKLGFVCRKWRQLAWATPNLWTTLYIGITSSTTCSIAELLPDFLHEWLGRSGVLPLTVYFVHDNDYSDSSYDEFPAELITRTRALEVATGLVDILNLHCGRWRNLYLNANADIFKRFSSSIAPKQLDGLELAAPIVRKFPFPTLEFMMESELNPTHLKLTDFPLTSLNVRWGSITHATLTGLSDDGLDFLRQASSLEYYCADMYELPEISVQNPILHPRLRSLELSTFHFEPHYILDLINLPSLEEWTQNMNGIRLPVAAMLSFLERSGCRIKTLNLDKIRPPSEDLDTLLQEIPSLERIRLCYHSLYSKDGVMDDILKRIFSSVPGSNVSVDSVEDGTAESFLPHLQFIEGKLDSVGTPFSWSYIPKLYRRGHRRSLMLRGFARKFDMSEKTALQLLHLVDEGVALQVIDLAKPGDSDFLENFRNSKHKGKR